MKNLLYSLLMASILSKSILVGDETTSNKESFLKNFNESDLVDSKIFPSTKKSILDKNTFNSSKESQKVFIEKIKNRKESINPKGILIKKTPKEIGAKQKGILKKASIATDKKARLKSGLTKSSKKPGASKKTGGKN
tara:strand:+ start:120 stop:530 length:411 start_codon:yes stop_codon:yes gene_type:complete